MLEAVFRISVFVCFVVFALLQGASVSQAENQCQPMPTVQWWDDIDQKMMSVYVDARHGGDWDAYIAVWQGHLEQVRAIHSKGGVVVSKKLDLKIKGQDLHNYILAVKTRLAITRCRAAQEMTTAARKLEYLETASGGEDPLPETVR